MCERDRVRLPAAAVYSVGWAGRQRGLELWTSRLCCRPRIAHPPIEVVWLSTTPYPAGIERQTVRGSSVPVYDREKTVADCFKFRDRIGTDVAIEALKAYARLRNRDIPKLIEHARLDRVDKVKRPYFRALV
jgi:hypothetical protein